MYDERANKGDLCIYSHYDGSTDSYVYEEMFSKAFEPPPLTYITPASGELFTDIHECMTAFKSTFFDREPQVARS